MQFPTDTWQRHMYIVHMADMSPSAILELVYTISLKFDSIKRKKKKEEQGGGKRRRKKKRKEEEREESRRRKTHLQQN